jgi:hypothetical protein
MELIFTLILVRQYAGVTGLRLMSHLLVTN